MKNAWPNFAFKDVVMEVKNGDGEEKLNRKKPQLKGDPETIAQALEDLAIDKPFYSCRVVGDRLEFVLYGGDVIYWWPEKED